MDSGFQNEFSKDKIQNKVSLSESDQVLTGFGSTLGSGPYSFNPYRFFDQDWIFRKAGMVFRSGIMVWIG
jgi:hypothetical protein